MINVLFVVMIPASLFLVACNNDDDDDNGGGGSTGSVSFDMAGDVNGSKDGQAALLESSVGSIFFSFNDFDPQTYSLTLFWGPTTTGGGTPIPGQGTYEITNSVQAAQNNGFWVAYTNTETGEEYGLDGVSGSLTISSYESDFIEGTFNFTAGKIVGTGTITAANGEFRAVNETN
jgi:hypothetical protein